MLTPTAETLLASDCRLFGEGACHIFAIVLQEAFLEERYELVRARISYQLPDRVKRIRKLETREAHHVFCMADEHVIDAYGVESWLRYTKRLENATTQALQLEDVKELRLYRPDIELVPVSSSELLDRSSTYCGEPANSFHLFTGEKFVDECLARARELIQPRRDQFSLRSHRSRRK